MNKHIVGVILLLVAFVALPVVVHLLQFNFVSVEEQLTREQSVYVGWSILGAIILYRAIRSWLPKAD